MSDRPDARPAADAALLDALEQRLGVAPLAQDEQAMALRGLVSRGALPAGLVMRLWRELMSRPAFDRLALWGGRDPARIADLARRRFGFSPALSVAAKPEEALAAARTAGTAAVLALDPAAPWWARLLAEPELQVFAVLPELAAEGPAGALAVGLIRPEPTGDDETLWVTDASGSEAQIDATLGRIGFTGRQVAVASGLKLFALAGYVQRDDPRLLQAPGRLTGVIGQAPQPFDL